MHLLMYICVLFPLSVPKVLVQKEWVWFGHPFHRRHSRSGKTKEDGPIFLQWTDCVWQVWKCCNYQMLFFLLLGTTFKCIDCSQSSNQISTYFEYVVGIVNTYVSATCNWRAKRAPY